MTCLLLTSSSNLPCLLATEKPLSIDRSIHIYILNSNHKMVRIDFTKWFKWGNIQSFAIIICKTLSGIDDINIQFIYGLNKRDNAQAHTDPTDHSVNIIPTTVVNLLSLSHEFYMRWWSRDGGCDCCSSSRCIWWWLISAHARTP